MGNTSPIHRSPGLRRRLEGGLKLVNRQSQFLLVLVLLIALAALLGDASGLGWTWDE